MKCEAALRIVPNRQSGIQRPTKGRKPNHRLVKQNRSYTVEGAAGTLGIHKNTVREWLKNGLTPIDDRRPILILGRELISFLKARNLSKKRPCAKGQMYCLRCRAPKYPAKGMLDFERVNDWIANAAGICPDCEGMMHRCIGLATIDDFRKAARLGSEEAPPRLTERNKLSLNSDLATKGGTDAKT